MKIGDQKIGEQEYVVVVCYVDGKGVAQAFGPFTFDEALTFQSENEKDYGSQTYLDVCPIRAK